MDDASNPFWGPRGVFGKAPATGRKANDRTATAEAVKAFETKGGQVQQCTPHKARGAVTPQKRD